jgi:tight adherence protein C
VRERLLGAGSSQTVESFRLDQIIWAAGGGCCAVVLGLVASLAGGERFGVSLLVAGASGAASGWVVVDRRLARALSRRRERVRHELPVALDLLTLSIMAGEAVPQAFARIGSTLGGEVGREFLFVVGSARGGISIIDALRELPARLPGPGVARLIDALCVGIERGAPLADTLRAQADDIRAETRRDLLESGARREILMLVPVVFLILPTIVSFALLPGLVSLDLLVP